MILDKLQSTQLKHLCSAKRSHNARTHLSTLALWMHEEPQATHKDTVNLQSLAGKSGRL